MKPNPIILPYPNKWLNPNARLHWRKLAELRQDARTVGIAAIRNMELRIPDVDSQMFIKAIPPDNQKRDDDNIISSLKSYRDGIFQALEVNDRRVRLTSFGFGEPCKPGAVYIWIEPLDKLPEWLED